MGRIERKKAKWGKKGENVQFREYFQNLAKTTHFSSVDDKGGGRGAEDSLKKRKMTIDEKDDPCKFSQTPPKKPKNQGGKVNTEEFLKLRQFWAKFLAAETEDQDNE